MRELFIPFSVNIVKIPMVRKVRDKRRIGRKDSLELL